MTANRIGSHHRRDDLDHDTYVLAHGQANAECLSDGSPSLTCNHEAPILAFSSKDSGQDSGALAPTLRSQNFKDSHMNGGGQVAIAFDTTQVTSKANYSNPKAGDPCHPLASGAHTPAIAFKPNQGAKSRSLGAQEEISPTLEGAAGGNNKPAVCTSTVRRLTPTECERLMGFPDGWTAGFSDSVRYRMLGNSLAVPIARWIAHKILASTQEITEKQGD